MARLLFQGDEGDPQEVPKHIWEEVIQKARQDAADELKDQNATAEEALARMQEKMVGVNELLKAYQNKFGVPGAEPQS
jgi:hypothetical protein